MTQTDAQFDAELEARLLRYTAVDSQSDEDSPTAPSTPIQFAMLHLLRDELTQIGATDIQVTDYGTLLATTDGPTVAFLAHVDTAPAYNATGVKPRVHRGYNGHDITYPDAPLTLSPETSAERAAGVGVRARHGRSHPSLPDDRRDGLQRLRRVGA